MAKINIINRGDKKNPSWQYRFEVASIGGKRKFKSKAGFRTKAEAEEAGTKALAEYNNSGKVFDSSKMSVSDFLDYWLESYCLPNLADSTTATYKTIIDNHIRANIGQYRLKSVDVITLQEFINDIYIKHNFSKAYLGSILKVLKGSFGYAANIAKLIPYNIAEPVKLPKFAPANDSVDILSKEEIEAVLGRFSDSQYQYYPMLIGYYTGMRVSEVYGLTWNNIDLEEGTIKVVQQVKEKASDQVKGRKCKKGEKYKIWYLSQLKTSSSYRTIKIGDALVDALKKLKAIQEENKKEYGEYYINYYLQEQKAANGRTEFKIIEGIGENPVQLVCVKESGEFCGTVPMKYASKVAREELGIENFHFHLLRHTHATILVANSSEMQVKDISDRLGHSSIRTTLDIYVKNTESMKTKSMEIFEEVGKLNLKKKAK